MMETIFWFQKADITAGLPELVQYGVVGICILLIIVLYKLMTDYRKSYDAQTEVLRDLTAVVESVKVMVQFQDRRGE